MQPKVSVIIPAYNVEDYIEKSLDSALSQTLAPIEVICVDDGSTDATPQILDAKAAACSNLTVLHQKNGGPSRARNAALDIARGEYIYFLDSDDRLIRSDALQLLYDRAEALRTDELFFNAQIAFSNEEMRAKYVRIPHLGKSYQRKNDYPDVLTGQEMFKRLYGNGDYLVVIWLRLYRRAFLEEHRMRFFPGIIHQDEVFSLECLSLAKRVAYYDICLYERLYRENSIMTSANTFRSIHGDCLGSQALETFASERLSGADKEFLRQYRNLANGLLQRGVDSYLALTLRERGAFRAWMPEGERKVVCGRLRGQLALRRKKKLRGAVRRCLPPFVRKALKKR